MNEENDLKELFKSAYHFIYSTQYKPLYTSNL